MNIVVQLRPDAATLARSAFASVPEVSVTTGRADLITINGVQRPLDLLVGARVDEVAGSATTSSRAAVRVVVAPTLTDSERKRIEEAGLSWCNARGGIHLVWPGTYIHIERTRRAGSRPAAVDASGIGAASLRGLQVMLTEPTTKWSVSKLASAAVLSTGQAHKLLTVLEANRLLINVGAGPQRRRILKDRDETLEWVAGIERGRRRPEAARTYLYARTFDDLVDGFADRAHQANLRYAVTASSGAATLGYRVLTNQLVLQVRVGQVDAGRAIELLGLDLLEPEDAGRGSNLELWTDTGELGTFRTEIVEHRARPVHVAPRVRVWLDMTRLGGREADAAILFKEQALDRP